MLRLLVLRMCCSGELLPSHGYLSLNQLLQSSEYDYSYAPQWNHVGRYMYWTPEINSIVNQYVNRAFGLPEDSPAPPVSLALGANFVTSLLTGVTFYP